jgi:hypothetical protein
MSGKYNFATKLKAFAVNFSLFSFKIWLCLNDADNPPISFLYNESLLPAPSNPTGNYESNVPQSFIGITSCMADLI